MDMELNIIPRILRDVSDGVLVLDKTGKIQFVNPSACKMLGCSEKIVGQKYAQMMVEDVTANDDFHQLVLEAVYDKENIHKGEVVYKKPDGTISNLRMTTSFLFDDRGIKKEGIIIRFSDISEIVELRQKQKNSSAVFMVCMVCVCSWVFFCMIWNLIGRPISTDIMTYLVMVIGIIMFIYILRNTDFTMKDIGLGFENIGAVVRTDVLITVVLVLGMALVKLILLKFVPGYFPEGEPFIIWDGIKWQNIAYIVVVILQEFLSRGVLHENLRRIFVGKYSEVTAIIVSSMIFGVLHVYLGIMYMCGAIILLSALGVLYRKQGTIWGLCIPHFVCGIAITMFGLA